MTYLHSKHPNTRFDLTSGSQNPSSSQNRPQPPYQQFTRPPYQPFTQPPNRYPQPQQPYRPPQYHGTYQQTFDNNYDPSKPSKEQVTNWEIAITQDERQKLQNAPRYIDPQHIQPYPLQHDLLMYYYYQQHNKYRPCHGAQRLTLSTNLMRDAQYYANYLASIGDMRHDPTLGRIGQGENLAVMSPVVGYAGVEMWYDEWKKYNFNAGVFSPGVGHFTQMVWKGSKEIGCAVAYSGSTKNLYVVCRYFPSGNINSQFKQNVDPSVCKY
uniref:SCP domain-containing protein n=1 Tax=Parastrongyloides trichosuri TaxID=131310 RepID=A0A0N4ZZC1_PARTI